MQDVEVVAINRDTAWRIDVGEDFGFIRTAIAIEITQPQDAATILVTTTAAVAITTDEQHAVYRGADKDGIAHRRWAREDACRESIRQRDVLQPLSVRMIFRNKWSAQSFGIAHFWGTKNFEFTDAAVALIAAFLTQERDAHITTIGFKIGGSRACYVEL